MYDCISFVWFKGIDVIIGFLSMCAVCHTMAKITRSIWFLFFALIPIRKIVSYSNVQHFYFTFHLYDSNSNIGSWWGEAVLVIREWWMLKIIWVFAYIFKFPDCVIKIDCKSDIWNIGKWIRKLNGKFVIVQRRLESNWDTIIVDLTLYFQF